jgi:hypothetical protein
MSDPKVVNAPERIWLVYGEADYSTADHSEFDPEDVCWSPQSEFPSDVGYVREDLHQAEVERLRADPRLAVSVEDWWRIIGGANTKAYRIARGRAETAFARATLEGLPTSPVPTTTTEQQHHQQDDDERGGREGERTQARTTERAEKEQHQDDEH